MAAVLAVLAALALPLMQGSAQARTKHRVTTHRATHTVVNRHRARVFNFAHLNRIQRRLVSTPLQLALGGAHTSAVLGSDTGRGDGLGATPPSSYSPAPTNGGFAGPFSNYFPRPNGECSETLGGSTKVNVNCLNLTDPDLHGRGQANNEEFIATDPFNPRDVVASDNDYLRGDGTCGAHYSLDGGNTWHNSMIPSSFSRGLDGFARQYWSGGGDTSVAWDTRGNAYESCQVFDRGNPVSQNPDQSSAFLVFRSTHNGGASWNFPGRYVAVAPNYSGNDPTAPFLDKQLLTVDNHLSSPYRDRVYVSWTSFAADGTAYIYESYSKDYGEHFSRPVLVSADSELCQNTYGIVTPTGRCNSNQYSDPFTGPDGALYVVWANFNNATTGNDNRNQMLIAKSVDGGNTFSPPQKVSDYYDLPDCLTYQGDNAGRACVPEKGSSTRSVFRATNYPSGAVDPADPSRVTVTFGSYINRSSNEGNGCVPDGVNPATGNDLYTGVKTPGACANKILISVSHDAGATFTGTATDPRTETVVPQAPGQTHTDQWFQWEAFTRTGKLAVDYYDRQYGDDEFTGSSDISLSGSRDLVDFGVKRVTSSSMPAPTEFYGARGGQFYGDYIGLSAVDQAYPIWSDTRSPALFVCPGTASGPGNPPQLCTGTMPNGEQANDEDTFMDRTDVPMGTSGRR